MFVLHIYVMAVKKMHSNKKMDGLFFFMQSKMHTVGRIIQTHVEQSGYLVFLGVHCELMRLISH